ncbi:PhzF family phenazine biosynthesis protein [Vandammella animalimorsus]|uniref:Phenazine biosynthesis protein PhzF n=1 Tax=Vandammella animalimorsus TaxID=2029117 RepID=A0A2A2AYZ9_9BURK|nr:PhzF family phenazine biosynthesis protein [Vandammella animalimorsus]PAT42997.1 phenazine biosynthesis protein PhzF [Vandammella animalimorsus]
MSTAAIHRSFGRPFAQIDVFTAQPGWGNPVAVVLDGAGLTDEAMQRFASWTNLSETTFVLPPTEAGADYHVRIFTPAEELPFAGHPTLGTCFAWLAAGGQPKDPACIVQQCAKGLIPIRREAQPGGGARLAFAAPPMQATAVDEALLAQVARALGLPDVSAIGQARWLDNGPRWLGLWLADADAVLALQPDHAALAALGVYTGVAGPYPAQWAAQLAAQTVTQAAGDDEAEEGAPLIARASREARAFAAPAARLAQAAQVAQAAQPAQAEAEPLIEVRAFVSVIGVPEDPVTGSLNASLAQWLMAQGQLPAAYVAAQGSRMGRAGRVHVARDAQGQVWVGGDCVAVVQGEVQL